MIPPDIRVIWGPLFISKVSEENKQASKQYPEHGEIWAGGFCFCVVRAPDQISETHSHRESWEVRSVIVRSGAEGAAAKSASRAGRWGTERVLPSSCAQNICSPYHGLESRQGWGRRRGSGPGGFWEGWRDEGYGKDSSTVSCHHITEHYLQQESLEKVPLRDTAVIFLKLPIGY